MYQVPSPWFSTACLGTRRWTSFSGTAAWARFSRVTFCASRGLETLKAEQWEADKSAPLVTLFRPMNYAKAKDIAALMKTLLGADSAERGSARVDERTNTLIISDVASQIPTIQQSSANWIPRPSKWPSRRELCSPVRRFRGPCRPRSRRRPRITRVRRPAPANGINKQRNPEYHGAALVHAFSERLHRLWGCGDCQFLAALYD